MENTLRIIEAINSGYEVTVQVYDYESGKYYDMHKVDEGYFNIVNVNGLTQYEVYNTNENLRFIIIL